MASDISDQVRADVARRAGHRCEYCLIHENDAGFPHQVDHVVSRKSCLRSERMPRGRIFPEVMGRAVYFDDEVDCAK